MKPERSPRWPARYRYRLPANSARRPARYRNARQAAARPTTFLTLRLSSALAIWRGRRPGILARPAFGACIRIGTAGGSGIGLRSHHAYFRPACPGSDHGVRPGIPDFPKHHRAEADADADLN